MESIVSYPDRGNAYGKNTYRGNCSGLLIKDLISQYRLKGLSDFMVGSGTTEDVVREAGIRGTFADLNRGYDMVSMDIPERAENIFWHPPYHDMVVYSDKQYSTKEVEKATGLSAETILTNDLSRCKDWDEFVKMMNYCMLKQFAALETCGGQFEFNPEDPPSVQYDDGLEPKIESVKAIRLAPDGRSIILETWDADMDGWNEVTAGSLYPGQLLSVIDGM